MTKLSIATQSRGPGELTLKEYRTGENSAQDYHRDAYRIDSPADVLHYVIKVHLATPASDLSSGGPEELAVITEKRPSRPP